MHKWENSKLWIVKKIEYGREGYCRAYFHNTWLLNDMKFRATMYMGADGTHMVNNLSRLQNSETPNTVMFAT
jgi:hypothetical protein